MAVAAATLDQLRRQVEAVVRGEAPARPGLPTGLALLDGRLTGGGLPRGRVTELVGPAGAGRTTLARALVQGALATGLWVAWVDATRTLAPQEWAGLERRAATAGAAGGAAGATGGRLCIVRPPTAARAAWCADVLLRSGAFGLVVLDGLPSPPRSVAVRLARLARDADAVLVVLGEPGSGGGGGGGGGGSAGAVLGSAVRLRVERRWERRERRAGERRRERVWPPTVGRSGGPGRPALDAAGDAADEEEALVAPAVRQLAVTVEKGGSRQSVEVSCAIGLARRLCAHSEVPDRRGVAARRGRGGAGGRARPAERGAAGAARAGDRGDGPRADRQADARDDARDDAHDEPRAERRDGARG